MIQPKYKIGDIVGMWVDLSKYHKGIKKPALFQVQVFEAYFNGDMQTWCYGLKTEYLSMKWNGVKENEIVELLVD